MAGTLGKSAGFQERQERREGTKIKKKSNMISFSMPPFFVIFVPSRQSFSSLAFVA
ncbi:MAG TPA: hypothetical protein VGH81_12070 [Rudaea sp.]|jgi:hypothetical protein